MRNHLFSGPRCGLPTFWLTLELVAAGPLLRPELLSAALLPGCHSLLDQGPGLGVAVGPRWDNETDACQLVAGCGHMNTVSMDTARPLETPYRV